MALARGTRLGPYEVSTQVQGTITAGERIELTSSAVVTGVLCQRHVVMARSPGA